jgi:hypothetical protein
MLEAQRWYDYFKRIHNPPGKIILLVDGVFGPLTIARTKQWLGLPIDSISIRPMWRALQYKVGGYTSKGVPNRTMWKGLQRLTGAKQDGIPGSDTYRHLQAYLNTH